MYVQSQAQQDRGVDLVCDGIAAIILCHSHVLTHYIFIYIIYTCFTCTKIITLHSVTADMTVAAVCHQVACIGDAGCHSGLPGQQSHPLFIYNNAVLLTSWCGPIGLAWYARTMRNICCQVGQPHHVAAAVEQTSMRLLLASWLLCQLSL